MPTSTYTPIATTTLVSAQTSVTFSTGLSGYTDLFLMYSPLANSNTTTHLLRVNNDSGSNYSVTLLRGDGSSASSARGSNLTSIAPYVLDFDNTTVPNAIGINFMNYSNTTTYKTILNRAGLVASGSGVTAQVALWRSTAAINRIDLVSSGTFSAGSTFTLYGIKAA